MSGVRRKLKARVYGMLEGLHQSSRASITRKGISCQRVSAVGRRISCNRERGFQQQRERFPTAMRKVSCCRMEMLFSGHEVKWASWRRFGMLI